MRESVVEAALRRAVEARGGRAYKWVSPGTDGVPDRLCVLPGRVAFVELKAPGKRPEPHQVRRLMELRALKQEAIVLDSIPAVERWANRRLTRAQAAARVREAIHLVLDQIGSPVDAPTNALAIELEQFAIRLEGQCAN